MLGVRTAAVRHVLRDAADVFEMQGDVIVPKNGQTVPGDPLTPLTPERWLQLLKTSEPYLFAAPGRAH
jgi:hypothetical protein